MSDHANLAAGSAPPSPPPVKHLAWIWRLWRERGGLIVLLFVLTFLSSAVAVTYPLVAKLLLDQIQGALSKSQGWEEAGAEINRLVLLVLAIGAAGLIASMFPGIRGATNQVFEHLLRGRYFSKVLAKNRDFFQAFRPGDIVTRLTQDIYNEMGVSWFLCSGIFRAIESGSKVVFCFAAMFIVDPKLTMLSMIPLPLMIAVFYLAQRRVYDTFMRNQESISTINAQLEMSFSGVRVIKAFACESKYERFFATVLGRRFDTELGVVRLEAMLQLVYQYLDWFAQIGVVFAGGWMAVRGEITIGTFYAFYSWLGMLVIPILDIPNLFVSGKRAFVNMDRLEEIAAYGAPPSFAAASADAASAAPASAGTAPPLPALAAPATAASPPACMQGPVVSVAFEHVDFTFEGRREKALDDCSFTLGKGERLAVIGPVGAGKSTLLRILSGLIEPSGGRVLVNGRAFSELDGEAFCAELGLVPQESLLFTGTIRENVAFGTRGEGQGISDGDYTRAVTAAGIADEIAAFPEGEATLLGQRGVSLSGGQRQRVAIARALSREPSLLLLDDITASLDATNEEKLWRNLEPRSPDMVTLVVSHRMSTLAWADKVLFLTEGRTLSFGRHEELLSSSPPYRTFIEEQLSVEEDAG
ncbi:MAG: ABC transporter ATP-binding protein [Spirochaetota bacterium]